MRFPQRTGKQKKERRGNNILRGPCPTSKVIGWAFPTYSDSFDALTFHFKSRYMQAKTAPLFPDCPDPNNHTETILITKLFDQWLRHIPS